jgi:hypothetical protein
MTKGQSEIVNNEIVRTNNRSFDIIETHSKGDTNLLRCILSIWHYTFLLQRKKDLYTKYAHVSFLLGCNNAHLKSG